MPATDSRMIADVFSSGRDDHGQYDAPGCTGSMQEPGRPAGVTNVAQTEETAGDRPPSRASAATLSALIQAAACGEASEVGELLMRSCHGLNINIPDQQSVSRLTPLLAAVRAEREDVVESLLRWHGHTDPNARGGASLNSFPLLEAARRGNCGIVSALMSAPGVNPNQRTGGECSGTPLLAAAARGHAGVVRLLLDTSLPNRADINASGSHGKTSLHNAAGSGHLEAVEALLEAPGVDPNLSDLDGQTPLWAAASAGHLQVVHRLLQVRGLAVDQPDLERASPLLAAARAGHTAVVSLLSSHGASLDVDKADADGRTPLLAASEAGHTHAVEALVSHRNLEAGQADKGGRTPLLAAATGGHAAVVQVLLSKTNASPNQADVHGATPLLAAAGAGHIACITALLKAPSLDITFPGPGGVTALSAAAEAGHEEAAVLLLRGAQERGQMEMINHADVYGRTPLFLASAAGHEAAVRVLLKSAVVAVNQPDHTGWSPLHVAAWMGRPAVLTALMQHCNTDHRLQDGRGMTAANVACSAGHQNCVAIIHRYRHFVQGSNSKTRDGEEEPLDGSVLTDPEAGHCSHDYLSLSAVRPSTTPITDGSYGCQRPVVPRGPRSRTVIIQHALSTESAEPPIASTTGKTWRTIERRVSSRQVYNVVQARPASPKQHASCSARAKEKHLDLSGRTPRNSPKRPSPLNARPRPMSSTGRKPHTSANTDVSSTSTMRAAAKQRPRTAQPTTKSQGTRATSALRSSTPSAGAPLQKRPTSSCRSCDVMDPPVQLALDPQLCEWAAQGSQPYERARRRLAGLSTHGSVRQALPRVLDEAAVLNHAMRKSLGD